MLKPIVPCLWFDGKALEAAQFYTGIFEDAGIDRVSHYTAEGFEIHGQPEGSVLTVDFRLNGQHYTALNGGPLFTFSEAFSLQVFCASQAEIDYYWERLTDGGAESECGWLRDRYGLSWQIVPEVLSDLLSQQERAPRVMKVLMQMRKLDIETLLKA